MQSRMYNKMTKTTFIKELEGKGRWTTVDLYLEYAEEAINSKYKKHCIKLWLSKEDVIKAKNKAKKEILKEIEKDRKLTIKTTVLKESKAMQELIRNYANKIYYEVKKIIEEKL